MNALYPEISAPPLLETGWGLSLLWVEPGTKSKTTISPKQTLP
jgi:hypothetical protein